MQPEFTREGALAIWSRLVAGWARHLDDSGARTLIDGVPNDADHGGSYEGVTRMFWGLGGWLSQPTRASHVVWRGATFDTAALFRRALLAGCDPHSPGYWGRAPTRGEYDQRTVESAQVAFTVWQTRDRIWASLTDADRRHVFDWLERFGRPPSTWNNNWALFWALNHAARKALGLPFDQSVIDSVLDYLDGVYCGGGWYDDGPARGVDHFDDYNYWVFGTHVLAWAQCDGHTQPDRRDLLLKRVRQGLAHFPYLFGADGAYTEYGRSLAYKFARLGAPLWGYHAGVWPYSVGMLRRLVGRHLAWYIDRGAVRADDTLRQSLTAEGSVAIREPYIATGSPYWAMLLFGALWTLPDDDRFWHTSEEPLPVEQADFTRIWREPGWVAVGSRASGAVHRFNARSARYPATYGKFLYSTLAPFNVGLVDGRPAPDSMLCLIDGPHIGHRASNLAAAVGEPGWLRMRYAQRLGAATHTVDTTVVVRGDLHLRAHRVTLDLSASGRISAVEGSAPLGFATGETPFIESDAHAGWEKASVAGRAAADRTVAICALRGYDGSQPAATWRSRPDLNSVHGHYVLPLLTVARLDPVHELVCLVYTGPSAVDLATLRASIDEAAWTSDGSFCLIWSDTIITTVPPLEA